MGEENGGMGCSEYLDCGNLGSCITGILPSCYDEQGVPFRPASAISSLFLCCFCAIMCAFAIVQCT